MMLDRIISLGASLFAICFGGWAAWMLYLRYSVMLGLPDEFIPASVASSTSSQPAQALASPANDLVFLVLLCLIVLVLARLLRWRTE
jgi:hypothetical protein